jgi:hypothetical protein
MGDGSESGRTRSGSAEVGVSSNDERRSTCKGTDVSHARASPAVPCSAREPRNPRQPDKDRAARRARQAPHGGKHPLPYSRWPGLGEREYAGALLVPCRLEHTSAAAHLNVCGSACAAATTDRSFSPPSLLFVAGGDRCRYRAPRTTRPVPVGSQNYTPCSGSHLRRDPSPFV